MFRCFARFCVFDNKLVPKWTQNDTKMTPNMTPKWPQNDPSMTPKWPPAWPQNDPMIYITTSYWRLESRISNILCPTCLCETWPVHGLNMHNFNKISSRDLYGQMQHWKISILAKSQPPNPSGHPRNAPKTPLTSVDLTRPHPKPFINHSKI